MALFPRTFSDRRFTLSLIRNGLFCMIIGWFMPIYNHAGGAVAVISVMISYIIVGPLYTIKIFKRLKFMDEKYPEKKSRNMNLLVSFLLPTIYILLITMHYYISENKIVNLNRDIYFFSIGLIYFMTTFLIFISKIALEEEK